MILNKIECSGQPKLKVFDKKHWILTEDYWVKLHTSCGTLTAKMLTGWITDLRSGSSFCDIVVPKKGNDIYTAIIIFHDFCYSGHLSKSIADSMLEQGMILSGIAPWRASLAHKAVSWFGSSGYYDLTDVMPQPYTSNRQFEKKLLWGDNSGH